MMRTDARPRRRKAQNARASIAFHPRWVEVTRIRPFCEELAPLAKADCFQVTIGDSADALRDGFLSIEFDRSVPLGDPVHLVVLRPSSALLGPPGEGPPSRPIQRASRGSIDFALLRGSDPADPGEFDAVTLTFLAMPAHDGDTLTLRVQVHFDDGRTLDATFSGPLLSADVTS
jgi:hypothetical protein